MLNFLIGCCVITICLCIILYFITIMYNRTKYKYNDLVNLLNFFLEESYSITYENDLITYVSNGIKDIPTDEKETIERNYVKQTLLLMGPSNEKLILNFFGGKREILIFHIVRHLRKKFNNDNLIKIIRNQENF